MKYIKRFEEKDNIDIDYSDISLFIREEVSLGNSETYNIFFKGQG